ncbi:hypothetical protein C7M61_004024 [Candidozyma pseudohaemuli]|uniref:CFEM domain-containing protein n=1 Tax=Candidozyma pseudohaemuli TaxID=418784 RepID=A0A2P7YJR6_9ASCO|nr:hypothetical protein C7M61_004024 [[Candida] pseudohaemulonii]PSK36206.1 hypothetical protein C7M61_004024 [[Candida] pseudohaemulonii]
MLKIATVAGLLAVALAADNPYATYPSVPKTASINGLADPIYEKLPECAKSCFSKSTSSTPCPYWDTGCLCVMTPWTNSVAECIAEQCKGNDVNVATSVAAAQCQSAGVWDPYFIIGGSQATLLSSAAAQTDAEDTPTSATSSQIQATSSSEQAAESSSPAITSSPAVSSDEAEEITTTPYVRSASINGFADPIYDKLPSCAQPCVMQSTSSLPCPYWDTGCLCVIQMFSFKVAECIADSCVGEDVNVATSLAFSVCKAGGVHTSPEWNINASLQEALEAAAAATGAVETTSSAPVIIPIPTVGPMPSFASSSSSSSENIIAVPTVAPVASSSSSESQTIIAVPTVGPALSLPENPAPPAAETSSAEESAEASAVASESAVESAAASESAVESAVESAAESAAESASAAASSASSAVTASAAANSTEVVSQTHSEIVTITSCDDDKCTEIESTATATSKTTEIVTITSCDEDKCVVTTVCPESESTGSVAGPVTKTRTDYDLVTITSCEDQKCTESVSTKAPKTVTVYEDEECVTVTECVEDKCKTFELSTSQVTKTVEAVETIVVTTYSKPIEVETVKSVSGTKTIDVTITKTIDVPVETKPAETKPAEDKPAETQPAEDSAKPTSVAPVVSTPAATSAAPTVSSFEGAAAVNTAGLGFVALLMALPFF